MFLLIPFLLLLPPKMWRNHAISRADKLLPTSALRYLMSMTRKHYNQQTVSHIAFHSTSSFYCPHIIMFLLELGMDGRSGGVGGVHEMLRVVRWAGDNKI